MAKQIDPITERSVEAVQAPTDLAGSYKALTTGDVAAARSLLTTDAILRVPGRSQIAGTYHGPESIAGFFASLKELSAGTARVAVTDVTQAADKGVVLQRITARRAGRTFDDSHSVVLKLAGSRIAELQLHPHDVRGHDAFWGRGPLLTPEDRDLLAAAIREGNTPPPDPNARKRVLTWFAIAVVVFLVSIVVFNWLNSHYSRQRLLATTTDLSSVDHVVMSDDAGKGRWQLDEYAMVRRLGVTNPLGVVRVTLPVPQSQCEQLGAALDSACSSGVISVEPPFDFSWRAPARVTGGVRETSRLDLVLKGSSEARSVARVDLVTKSLRSPSLCFTEPTQSAALVMTDAGGRRISTTVRPGLRPVSCDNGVALSIGTSRSPSQQTSIIMGGVSVVGLDASGTLMDLDGLAGKLAVVGIEQQVFDDAAHVISSSSSSTPILAEINVDEVDSRFTARSDEVKSVLTDDGEQLPTQWERLPQPLVALIGSVATALVLPALIAFLQMWRDRLLLGRRRPQ